MKRPLATIGITYLSALLLAVIIGPRPAIIFAGIFAIISVIAVIVPKIRIQSKYFTIFATASMALLMYFLGIVFVAAPVQTFDGAELEITAEIVDIPYEDYGKKYYIVETDKMNIDGWERSLKIRLSTNDVIDADYYDKITCKVALYQPMEESRDYFYSNGQYVHGVIEYGSKVIVEKTENKPPNYYILKMKARIVDAVYELLPSRQAGLVACMLMGDKVAVDNDVRDDFNKTNTYHLLVVSGLHMSTIAWTVFGLLMVITRKREKLSAAISMAVVILFMLLTGLSPSVVRSGIMMLIILFGKIINRQSDSLNSLGIAALVLCLPNPFAAGNVGMLMSFSSTLGIILFYNRIYSFLTSKLRFAKPKFVVKLLKAAIAIICLSICTVGMTMPISIICFGSVSPYFLLTNLLLVPAAAVLLNLALLMVLFYFLPFAASLSHPFAVGTGIVANYMTRISSWFAQLPGSYFVVEDSVLRLLIALCFAVVITLLITDKKKKLVGYVAFALAAVLVVTGISSYLINYDKTYVNVLNVGNGATVVLENRKSKAVLACGGDSFFEDKVRELVSQNDKSIDLLLAPGFTGRSSRYFVSLMELEPEFILAPSIGESLIDVPEKGLYFFEDSYKIELWDGMILEILEFDEKVWTRLTAGEVNVLICPANGGDFADLPESFLNNDLTIISTLPKSHSLLNSKKIIISDTNDDASESRNLLTPCAENLPVIAEQDYKIELLI